jgi:hypothetical protein
MDSAALSGEQLIPVNVGNSPASVAVNLLISRSFGIGARQGGRSRVAGDIEPLVKVPTSNTARQDRGGPGRGSLGPGGLSGNDGSSSGGSSSVGADRKYNLRFSVQALNIFNDIDYGEHKQNFAGQHFWARGYFVSTVGRDETAIREYIRNQEVEDKRLDQLKMWK